MRYDWRGASLVTVHNFRNVPREVVLRPDVPDGETLVDLLHDRRSEAEGGDHHLVLEPYGYHWFRVGGMNYTLTRNEHGTKAGR